MNVNYRRRRVEIKMYCYEVDTKNFFMDLQRAVSQAKGSEQHFDLIVDFSEMKGPTMVMPRNIADDAETMNKWCGANGLLKSASVLTSALFKLQLQRVTPDGKFAMFENSADAEAWLDEA